MVICPPSLLAGVLPYTAGAQENGLFWRVAKVILNSYMIDVLRYNILNILNVHYYLNKASIVQV